MTRCLWTALMMAAATYLVGQQARADVKPHALFCDGMVLQRGMECPIWGTADPEENVSVSLAATKGNVAIALSGSVDAGKDGKWRINVRFTPEMAGGPYEMVIKGKNTIILKDVYIGDVWICSGQSNMEWPLSRAHNADEAIKNAKNPKIRLFTVPKNTSDKPLTEFKGQPKWQECNPDTVKNFSAVGYFFGRDLQKALLDVPIGLIHTSWGGTVAEAWATRAALESNPEEVPGGLGQVPGSGCQGQGGRQAAAAPPAQAGRTGQEPQSPLRALQRHDPSAATLRHQGRHLVSG
jgi:sialate O-acetylesterase